MKEWQMTLTAVACITAVTVAGEAAYSGHLQSTKGMPEVEKSALLACSKSLLDKDMRDVREVCLEQGFITMEQFYRAPT